MATVAETAVIRLDLPATYQYLNILGACLAAVFERIEGLEERDLLTYSLELALHETCTNIVEHAYAGTTTGRIGVILTLATEPRRLVVDLHDTGQTFDIAQAAEPDLDAVHTNGYGLYLMRQLMDEVSYMPENGNNRWRLVKHF